MERPLISIVVPVYKAERYLKRCIESILAQTLSDFELILVDDGSPDRSGAICDDYAGKDKRIKVIHQKNGGAAKARAAGVAEALGEYLGFVDSDDWIDPDMYEFLLEKMLESDADISQCMYWEYDAQGRTVCFSEEKGRCYQRLESLQQLMVGNVSWMSMCMKLYRRKLFEGVPLENGLRCGEDSMVNYYLLRKARKTVVWNNSKYHYFNNPESALRSGYEPWKTEEGIAFVNTVLQEEERNESLIPYCRWRYIQVLYSALNQTIGSRKYQAVYRRTRDELLSIRKEICGHFLSTRKYRLGLLLIQYCPALYRVLLKMRSRERNRRLKRRKIEV
ncbi:MAG: glycosyltransferase [Eubacteriales bacterium]|nr:glycosyltransferase [Eubacteriales bacterium]